MNWKLKARIQRLVSHLPSSLSYDVYYFIQRKFGGLRSANPISRLQAGITVVDCIRKHNQPVESQTFLEIGTGHQLNLPIALWLCGASQIMTVDLNPYLKPNLVFKDISFIRENRQAIIQTLGDYSQQPIFQERLDKLIKTDTNMSHLLDTMNIKYMAPVDAAHLDLESESIDYHVSYTVLEHIPPKVLQHILLEGKRVLRDEGLFVHCIDLSDHFSHSDRSISAINFLQFSELEWEYCTGNRYMYHNRLRIDEFVDLLDKTGLKILSMEIKIDQRALKELRNGFPLYERFQDKAMETNATTSAWVVATSQDAD